ncbi:MAG: phage terminase large subunit [Bacteroidales bacterium]|nr:phage terminase large subunit [Bacteroidales bacterium]
MASKLLLDKYEEYKAAYDRGGGGAYMELVEAFISLTKFALLTEKEIELGLEIADFAKKVILDFIRVKTNGGDFWTLEHWAQDNRKNFDIVNKMYLVFKLESFWKFDSYMYYLERKRPYDKRFYYPRRKVLKVVVDDLEDMEIRDLIDTYGLSMPSRVGKSGLMIFFLTWVGMRKPGSHNAMGGHSGQLVKRFFKGLDNITDTDEYTYQELFFFWNSRMRKCVQKKSSDPAELTINLGKPDEFATFTCRSSDATWTGAIDVSEDGYLYVDDLVRDREHSLSAFRMENTYQEYQNKMLDRMNDGAKKILVGTLWSVLDPLVREEIENRGNDRARFRKIPALDENDESNFQYEYKGFSTEYYREMRDRLDKAEWCAKFQQAPFVRESLAFPTEELNFIDEYDKSFKRVIAFCDPAFGSGDNCSMPILGDYGEDGVVIDWLHDKRVPDITVPRIVEKIDKNHIVWLQIEKNRGGDLFAEKVQKEMDKQGIHFCKITLKNANVKMSKEDRISGYSGYIKKHFSFLKKQTDEYRKAIEEVTIFSTEGKNVHEDSADALTGLAEMKDTGTKKTAIVHSSLF